MGHSQFSKRRNLGSLAHPIINQVEAKRQLHDQLRRGRKKSKKIVESRHPEWEEQIWDWMKFRLTFKGGRDFVDNFLQSYSTREDRTDFAQRKALTYTPAHAKSSIKKINNAIFQRLCDVTRSNKSQTYQRAIIGEIGGVDFKNSSMNTFLGNEILPDLLSIGKVYVFVDNISREQNVEETPGGDIRTLADESEENTHPYMYIYRAEDVLNWTTDDTTSPTKFKSVLLQEHRDVVDPDTMLPVGRALQYRLMWVADDGFVHFKILGDEDEVLVDDTTLDIHVIPLVEFSIQDSLLRDTSDYQIAMMNIASSDMSFLFKANFSLYTEMYDPRDDNLMRTPNTNDPVTGDPVPQEMGVLHGRQYALGTDRPEWISPPVDPVITSMKKQETMKNEIKELMDLALSSLGAKVVAQSGESKKLDNLGLEAGLSFIGLVLMQGEIEMAMLWNMYESNDAVPMITYPKSYSLKTDADRREEAQEISDLIEKVNSLTYKKELAKRMIQVLMNGIVPSEIIEKIKNEIDLLDVVVSNPDKLILDIEAGILSPKTAARLKGYSEDEVEKAQEARADRIRITQEAQTSPEKQNLRGEDTGGKKIDTEKEVQV